MNESGIAETVAVRADRRQQPPVAGERDRAIGDADVDESRRRSGGHDRRGGEQGDDHRASVDGVAPRQPFVVKPVPVYGLPRPVVVLRIFPTRDLQFPYLALNTRTPPRSILFSG